MRDPVMEGRGYYNAHSELQARSAEEADAMLVRALAAVTIWPGPLTIADFGSSQGHNSMRQMALALDRLTVRTVQSRDTMVVHTDLPHSDFTSLFVTLETAPDSYRRGRDHVFPSAVGHSFYERLLPAASLTFGWSAFALHWMSALPIALRAHIWPIAAAPDEAKSLAEVAATDWRNFLAHRAEELVPGGQLVLVIGAVGETGATGLEPMMDLANSVLKALVAEGKISAELYTAMTIASRPRVRNEFTAPFDKGEVPALALEELLIAETPNAAMLRWQQTGDAAVFAADITGFFLAAFGPSLFGDNDSVRNLFTSRFTAAVALAPADVARPLVTATLRIARRLSAA
jgi:S-adenosylmethionine-dependent carboxyl methyltransferase